MTNPAIAARGLRKSYRDKNGEKVVLDGIDLTVPEGTIFSLLGPNGAGKTTTVQILSTLIRADGGTDALSCPAGSCQFIAIHAKNGRFNHGQGALRQRYGDAAQGAR